MESGEVPVSRYRRWNELLELLAADGQLQVDRAAEVLGVSAATVRRDFDEPARQQMLTRIRGGVDGIDAAAGATAHHEGEASTNRLMAERAAQVVVAADSSKVGRRAFARICAAAEVDMLVTDAGIAPADAARLADAGAKIVTA
jgi:DeoR/GlpR family transcriptional regulator of sugar metabolism